MTTATLRSFLFGLCAACAIALAASRAAADPPPSGNPPPKSEGKKLRKFMPGQRLRTPAPPSAADAPAPNANKGQANAPGAAESPGEGIKPFETGIDYQPTSPKARVTFNLEDADLPELVRLMSQITGRSFILPSKSRSIKATVYAPTKVTAAEAYQAFLSILELNGMALVPAGRYLKIVESGRVEGRAVPLYVGNEEVPAGDRYVTRIQPVKNISAEDAAKLLERFKSGDGGLTAYAPTNVLIMTDTGSNLRRMLKILEQVDIARTGEQMWVEQIHHANATDLEKRLNDIFDVANGGTAGGKGKKPNSPSGATTVGGVDSRLTKVIADERTNSLVIVATEPAYLRVLEVLKYLDVSMEGEGHMHVHRLQHTDAEEVANTLTNLIGKGGGNNKGGGQGEQGVFEGKVAITANKTTNSLVITSSAHDYASLKSVINMLDSPRKQVFIEAVIMELNVNRSSKLGLGYHGGVPNVPTNSSVSVVGFNSATSLGGLAGIAAAGATGDFLSGLAVGVQGPMINSSIAGVSIPGFGVALNALASSGDANVLSTPHLIASDNVEAEISVGENVPLQTSSFGGGLPLGGMLPGATGAMGGAAGAAGLLGGLGGFGLGTVPRDNVGTTVTITPHLNDASEIRLTIAEEISAAGPPSQSGNLGVRSISRTKAKTEVVVRDQQTVVIGGLMRDEVSTGTTKIPIIGDIPLVGALFRTTEKTKVKKNLLLFLTPYIIRSPSDLRAVYERKMRERQEFMDRYYVFSDTEYEPPVDYSRTRGLLGEILVELKEQDTERKLAEEAAKKPELGHEPQPPIGGTLENGHSGAPGESASPDAPGPGHPAPLNENPQPGAAGAAPPANAPEPNAPPPPEAEPPPPTTAAPE